MHPAGNMLCNISSVPLRTGAKFFKFLKKITVIWMTIAKFLTSLKSYIAKIKKHLIELNCLFLSSLPYFLFKSKTLFKACKFVLNVVNG